MKLYQYPNCSTCRKAIKFLNEHEVQYQAIDITQQPPTTAELTQMLAAQGEIKKLFNISGLQYRELDMKNRLPDMTDQQAIELLAENGKLIKRPFLIGDSVALVGFKEAVWGELI